MRAASGIRAFLVVSAVATLAAILGGPSTVLAQTPPVEGSAPSRPPARPSVGVGVVAPTPPPSAPEFGFETGMPPDQGGTREEEFYSERTRSIHQPAFVRGAVTTKRTSRNSGVRVGLSGWTAPRIPFDSQRESSGGAAFGLTIQWGVPLPDPSEPALPVTPASAPQR
jgi:hypothetical protein